MEIREFRAEGHHAAPFTFSSEASGLPAAKKGAKISLARASTSRLCASALSRAVRHTAGGQAVMTSIRPVANGSRSSAVGR